MPTADAFTDDDSAHMQAAIEASRQAAALGNMPFGATLDDIIDALGDPTLAMSSKQLLATASPAVRVEGPLLREAAARVLHDFAQAPVVQASPPPDPRPAS